MSCRHCERSEALQELAKSWNASSLSLVAMTARLRSIAKLTRQPLDRKRAEDRIALADLADLGIVGAVSPGRYLLCAVPDLNNDAGRSGALELGDVEARRKNLAAGLLDTFLRPRRVFVDVARNVPDRDFGHHINRRLALRMKLMCCGGAQHDANKQRGYDGEDCLHGCAPRNEQRESNTSIPRTTRLARRPVAYPTR